MGSLLSQRPGTGKGNPHTTPTCSVCEICSNSVCPVDHPSQTFLSSCKGRTRYHVLTRNQSKQAARVHALQPLQGMSNDLPRRYSGCVDCSARNPTLPTTSCVSRRLQLYGVCLSMGTPSINTCDTARMQIQSHLKSANIISKN